MASIGGVAAACIAVDADVGAVLEVRQRRVLRMGRQPVVDEPLDERLRRSVLRMKLRPRSESK